MGHNNRPLTRLVLCYSSYCIEWEDRAKLRIIYYLTDEAILWLYALKPYNLYDTALHTKVRYNLICIQNFHTDSYLSLFLSAIKGKRLLFLYGFITRFPLFRLLPMNVTLHVVICVTKLVHCNRYESIPVLCRSHDNTRFLWQSSIWVPFEVMFRSLFLYGRNICYQVVSETLKKWSH